MFNRKKREIERLQKNITKLNENRMELSGENIRLQKEVANLNEKFTCLETAIREESRKIAKIYDILNPKPTKDVEIKPKKKVEKKNGTK